MKVHAPSEPTAPVERGRPDDARDLAAGEVFGSAYRIVRRIKAGGMGAIYEVVHLGTRRRRALKVLLPTLIADGAQRERFTREATVTAEVKSEHLVEVFDAGIDTATGLPFLVMDLLEGEDLGELLARRGRLDPAEVVELLGQAAHALDRTHAAGIVHRDLKPGNVFVSRRDDGSPWVKLLDFGIAKIAMAGEEGANNTSALGTPLYMAPEQMRSNRRLGPAADLYALAQLAYRMLVGAAFWDDERREAESVIALLVTISRGAREPATARAARRGVTLPPAFDPWFARAAAARPKQRYDGAAAMIADLAAALGESAPRSLVRSLAPEASGASTTQATPPEELPRISIRPPDSLRAPTHPTMPSRAEEQASAPQVSSVLPPVADPAPPDPAPPDPPAPAAAVTPATPRRASRRGLAAVVVALMGLAGIGLAARIGGSTGARLDASGSALTDLPSPRSSSAAAIAAYRTGLQEARDGVLVLTGFERALALDPELAEAHLQLASRGIYQVDEPVRAHFREAQLRRAALSPRDRALLETIEPLVARDPSDWAEASRRAERATDRFPRDAQLWVVRSYFAQGISNEEARQHSARALALDPVYGEALATNAEALAHLGRITEARRELDACVEIAGSAYAACAFFQMELDVQEGDCALLEAHARRALAGSGQLDMVQETLARALAARGAPADAVREALRAEVRATPASRRRRVEVSGAVRQALLAGDFTAAERDARELLEVVEPDARADRHVVPAHWLAQALAESGRGEEAGRVARAFLDRSDGWDPDPRAEDYAMARDRTVQLLAIARAGGQLDPAEAAARRDAWIRKWSDRTLPGFRRFLWMHAFPPLANSAAEAREALASQTSYGPLPTFRPKTLAGAEVGRTLLLAGRTDEAIARLEEATRGSRAGGPPGGPPPPPAWHAIAAEARAAAPAAGAATAGVISRWGHASPRSVTAEHARARMSALACPTR